MYPLASRRILGGIGQGGGGGATFVPSISPTLGASIVVDGDMELAGVTNWAASGTPTTREKSGTQVHGGSQALHVVTDGSGDGTTQTMSATANRWLVVSAWAYVATGSVNIAGSFGLSKNKTITGASWQRVLFSELCTGTGPRILTRGYTVPDDYYVDDVVIQEATLATCFANPRTGGAQDTVSANVTGVSGCTVGVVANLDSITTPLNYVLAVIDKDNNKAWLYQVSNGVYTAKINGTAITYAADKLIEIRHTAETTYQLFYNGSQVGADQTISDANINNNTLYCQFSTYSGNTFTSFTLTAVP